MNDWQARFLAKVAFAAGRVDFWNLENELTPSELVALQVLYSIEPWGEDRADLRAAVNTTVSAGVAQDAIENAIAGLTGYLEVNRQDQIREITPDEAARMLRSSAASIVNH